MTFDPLADDYDTSFTERPIGRMLRSRVQARLSELWQTGDSVLELGCGTGEDAAYLGAQGIQVTATDASPGMLAQAHHKTRDLPLVTCAQLDLNVLPDKGFDGPYSGVLANFGVLNCVLDQSALAAWLAARIRPGGVAAFAVMSPHTLWEIGWHVLHLNLRQATRRLRGPAIFQPDAETRIEIHYPGPNRLAQDFTPMFRQTALTGLGLFLPPSEMFAVVEKRPALLRTLSGLDNRLTSMRVLARFADHYWIEFARI